MRSMKRNGGLVVAAWLSVLAAPVCAQTPGQIRAAEPGATQERQMEEERRRREMERDERAPVTEPLKRPVTELPAPQAESEAVRFFVREIQFTESKILGAEELGRLAAEYQGRELSLADLRQLTVRINELYRSKGVVTAQALLPPQDVTSGIIRVRLVEGRLGKVNLDGNASTNASYITDLLRVQPDELMDLPRLEEALVRFNRTNDVQLRAELRPGEAFATTDLNLAVREPPRQEFRFTLDTLGAESTGKNRAGLAYQNRSLFGFRDDLMLAYIQALGQESAAATYAIPVNTWGGRLNLGYYKDKTWIKKGALSSLNITGESESEVVSLRQPIYVDSKSQLDVVVGGKTRRSTNWIDRVFLSRTDTNDANLGLEAQWFSKQSNWFAGYTRYFGDAKVVTTEHYVIDRGTLRFNSELGYGLSFRGMAAWQATHKELLPSSEALFIGGEGSVRGYPVGVYSGDTGQVVNLEVHHPLLTASDATNGLGATGFFFADYGRVKPFRPPNSTLSKHDNLTGIGWGVHSTLGKHFYARLVFGYGLDRIPNQPRNYEISFKVVATAF